MYSELLSFRNGILYCIHSIVGIFFRGVVFINTNHIFNVFNLILYAKSFHDKIKLHESFRCLISLITINILIFLSFNDGLDIHSYRTSGSWDCSAIAWVWRVEFKKKGMQACVNLVTINICYLRMPVHFIRIHNIKLQSKSRNRIRTIQTLNLFDGRSLFYMAL